MVAKRSTVADAAMKDKDYEKATAYYKNACDIIPNAPNSQSLYDTALRGFCEASTKLAEQRITEGRYGRRREYAAHRPR
ncbi:MAG: hypothetical protein WDN28_13600 [Chthoniobacter sp.]